MEAAIAAGAPQLLLLLDHVQDPGNVGAIIRAAEACGATAVITGPGTADPFGWKALRGSMGSAFRLPVAIDSPSRGRDAARPAMRACVSSRRCLAAARRSPNRALRSQARSCLAARGPACPKTLVATADEHLTIPMRPPVESLNVAIAAALILYEASRQRLDVAV